MSFGKKSKSSKPKIKAPARITNIDFQLPTGDTIQSRVHGNTQTTKTILSGPTKNSVDLSQVGLNRSLSQLGKTEAARSRQVDDVAGRVYNQQKRLIDKDSSQTEGKIRSNLSKTFGSSYNSTFGNHLLGQVYDDRLNRLNDARVQSDLLAENFLDRDEDRKMRRANLFLNILNDINSQSQGLTKLGADLLQNETQRATNVAIQRARLLNNYNINQDRLRTSRQNTLLRIVPSLLKIGTSATGLG